jgi:hypothetical protein
MTDLATITTILARIRVAKQFDRSGKGGRDA